MDRRIAVKNIFMAIGITVSTPTLISILNSCSENKKNWLPTFYDKSEIKIVSYLVDIILPKTSVVGGEDLNLSRFVDNMCADVLNVEKQNKIKLGLNEFINRFEEHFNKNFSKGSIDEYEVLIGKYMNISKEKEIDVFEMLNTDDYKSLSVYQQQDYLLYQFLTTVRELSFLGYYTSEMIVKRIIELL